MKTFFATLSCAALIISAADAAALTLPANFAQPDAWPVIGVIHAPALPAETFSSPRSAASAAALSLFKTETASRKGDPLSNARGGLGANASRIIMEAAIKTQRCRLACP